MQKKACSKKLHVKIDDIEDAPKRICGLGAVGGKYNSTRDTMVRKEEAYEIIKGTSIAWKLTVMNINFTFANIDMDCRKLFCMLCQRLEKDS